MTDKRIVYVLACIDPNKENDLVFRLVAKVPDLVMMSKLHRLEGQAGRINNNPYSIYGHAVVKFMYGDKSKKKSYNENLNILVLTSSSGSLMDDDVTDTL
jgi:hypothetical protein